MFTGIVEAIGVVRTRSAAAIEVETPGRWRSLKVGDSLAVNGTCLTVVQKRRRAVLFELLNETKKRSTLAKLALGERVNLERPCKAGGRLGGHVVLGHVDGVGRVRKILSRGREKSFLISTPGRLRRFLVEKGSIAVDGVSLTVGKISGPGFWVHCVPHTLRATCLGLLRLGSTVNLEADILLKMAGQALRRR
jgi:riboflavin synthase